MKAKVYRLEIHDSILDWNHGFGRTICEIYIPELNISYNSEACFESSSKNRYKGKHVKRIGEIEVPDTIIKYLKSYINAQKELSKVEKWFNKQEFKKKFDKSQKKKYLKELRVFGEDTKKNLRKVHRNNLKSDTKSSAKKYLVKKIKKN